MRARVQLLEKSATSDSHDSEKEKVNGLAQQHESDSSDDSASEKEPTAKKAKKEKQSIEKLDSGAEGQAGARLASEGTVGTPTAEPTLQSKVAELSASAFDTQRNLTHT